MVSENIWSFFEKESLEVAAAVSMRSMMGCKRSCTKPSISFARFSTLNSLFLLKEGLKNNKSIKRKTNTIVPGTTFFLLAYCSCGIFLKSVTIAMMSKAGKRIDCLLKILANGRSCPKKIYRPVAASITSNAVMSK
jgi:hypothetical protein